MTTEYSFSDELQDTVVSLKQKYKCKSNSAAIRKALALLLTVQKYMDEDGNIYVAKTAKCDKLTQIKLIDK